MNTMYNTISLYDKLDSFVENVVCDVKLDVMLEDAGMTATKVGHKISAAWAAIKKLIAFLIDKCKALASKVKALITRQVDKFKMPRMLQVSEYVLKGCPNYPDYSKKNVDKIDHALDEIMGKTTTIQTGAIIDVKRMNKNINTFTAAITKLDNKIKRLQNSDGDVTGDPDAISYYRKLLSFFRSCISDSMAIVLLASKGGAINEKYLSKKSMDMINANKDDITKNAYLNSVEWGNESASDTNLLRAQLLMEAAELLNEDGEAENSELVGGAANMMDDDIDDIPDSYEEDPVVDDDYDSESVMGATSQRVSDETKEQLAELCDGDKEVMDIITDDDGSAIIDNSDEAHRDGESVSESIDFFW